LVTSVELQQIAEQAGRDLEGASAQDVLRWAVDAFGDRFVIASSMGDGLLAHLASSVASGVDVLFLDTGYHFAETIGTRDAVAQVYDVHVRTVLPLLSVVQQDAAHGERLYERDPNACCALRKVEPLARGLEPYTAWASGIRRDEAATRRDIGVVEWDAKRSMVKVNPIAAWTSGRRRRLRRRARRARSTRWRTTATRPSAARPAPAASPRGRTPAPAAGPAARRRSAGLHV
jgi:phosphoadenosine phosphosulfate reductase